MVKLVAQPVDSLTEPKVPSSLLAFGQVEVNLVLINI